MSLFVVDKEKCKRDGICVAECPFGLIELKDKESVPVPIVGADEMCINCGHCVAVCPHGAMSLATMKSEECVPVQKDLLPGMEQIEHLMRSRRSIRIYKERAVENEDLTKLIDVARHAPTGSNSQQVKWIVINDKDEVRRLAEIAIDWLRHLIKEQSPMLDMYRFDRVVAAWESGDDGILRSAPAIIVAHAPKDYPAAVTDCSIALTYFELAASAFGIGTCWAGLFPLAADQWPPLQQALGLSETDTSLVMMAGYPKYSYHRIPKRNDARVEWR
jgi:nitroreductase/NAD-dependent dihydropyrimidine dehydrogenase PreA subunit